MKSATTTPEGAAPPFPSPLAGPFTGVSRRAKKLAPGDEAAAKSTGIRQSPAAVFTDVMNDIIPSPEREADLIALDDALNALERTDPGEAKVVELRFFGGLSEEETAAVLGISGRTVRREWDHAKVAFAGAQTRSAAMTLGPVPTGQANL